MLKTKRKQTIANILRKLHLLQLFDHLRYLVELKRNWSDNKLFVEEKPNFRLPPPDLAYDAYGHTNWHSYYWTGKETAEYISDLIKKNDDNGDSISISEWGCGAARILRHIPLFFPDRCIKLYGFDYNSRTIQWCRDNIPNIVFKHNLIAPPLPQESNSFDSLYCLSVFTHLSYERHIQWIRELSRVVKPNGIIILTTHGNATRANLLKNEMREYDAGKLVIRGMVREGKRNYVAYHPPSFVKNELLRDYTVISHITNPPIKGFAQDIWVVRNIEISYEL